MISSSEPRVAVVHDYLTQMGGAERVALSMLETFPGARLITGMYEPRGTFSEFGQYQVETLWPSSIAAFRDDPRRALPVLARAFGRYVVDDVDVVICSSSGWSHGVRSAAPKLAYCYTPARWLYRTDDYLIGSSLSVRTALRVLSPRLRTWDQRVAGTVTQYLAISSSIQERIAEAYDRDSDVVFPPVQAPGRESIRPDNQAIESKYFLTVARPRGYKNLELIADAAQQLGVQLVAVGKSLGMSNSARTVWTGLVTDEELRWLYENCIALVSAASEDFGLTPLEANFCGRPAIAPKAGGFLDTINEGVNGVFFERGNTRSLAEAMRSVMERQWPKDALESHAEGFGVFKFSTSLREHVSRLSVKGKS
jgi:glycosyltransferase involved in cell wall biosynthesis